MQERTLYLSKRLLYSMAQHAGRKACRRAMKSAGFILVAEHGFLFRIDKKGERAVVGQYDQELRPKKIKVD